jgi:hypothetical protein
MRVDMNVRAVLHQSSVVTCTCALMVIGLQVAPPHGHTESSRDVKFVGNAVAIIVSQRTDTTVLTATPPLHSTMGSLVENLNLGGARADSAHAFSRLRIVSVGVEGSIYAIDVSGEFDRTGSVRKFDRTGKHLLTLGRPGRGPGEFTDTPYSVRELPDGRIVVATGARGLMVYSAKGEFISNWPIGYRLEMARDLFLDKSGSLYVLEWRRDRAASPQAGVVSHEYTGRFFRLRSDGTIADTIPYPQPPRAPDIGRPATPFDASDLFAWSPLGYFVTARTSTYAINLLTPSTPARPYGWKPSGSVTSIRRSVSPQVGQPGELDDWQTSIIAFMRGLSKTPNWQWPAGRPLPRTKPPLRDLFVAVDGRIWVRLSQPALLNREVTVNLPRRGESAVVPMLAAGRRWMEPLVFDVIEPNGRYVGQVRFPSEIEPRGSQGIAPIDVIRGDTVWARAVDSDGLDHVKRYIVSWSAPR